MNLDPSLLAVLAAVAAVFLLRRLVAGRAPAEGLRARLEAGAFVVDVRSPEEFRAGAYPGAVNIPLPSLAERVREVPRDRPVIVYCASGMRSATAARLLRQAGVADVVNGGGLRHLASLERRR